MAKSSEIAEAFAQLVLMREKGDAAARHLSELCADNPEMMRKATEVFANIAEIFTRWKERARDNQRPLVIQRRSDREVAYLRLKQLLNLPLDRFPFTMSAYPAKAIIIEVLKFRHLISKKRRAF